MARDVSTLEFHNRIITLQFVMDIIVAFIGLTVGYFLRFYSPIQFLGNASLEPPAYTSYLPLIAFGSLLLLATYGYLGLYSWKNLLRPRRVMPIVVKGAFFWFIVFSEGVFAIRRAKKTDRTNNNCSSNAIHKPLISLSAYPMFSKIR